MAELLLDSRRTALVSTLNWSEVFDRLLRGGMREDVVESLLGRVGLHPVDFDLEQGKLAAKFRMKASALSLADRACLALANSRKATAWTTDKVWARAKVGVPIEILR